MAKVLVDIEKVIRPGKVIPKPEAKGNFKVKGWGRRRGERALIYTIPNWTNPSNPYEKGVTEAEWVQAAKQLTAAGNFTSSYCRQFMSKCYAEGSCNFTTIGGVFELLKYATREGRGLYRRLPEYEGED